MKTTKLRTFVGQAAYFEPLLTSCFFILTLFSKIALLLETSTKFRWLFIDFIFFKSIKIDRSRAKRLQNFDDILKNRVPARDVVKTSSIYLLKGEILGRSFWYRIDIGFLDFAIWIFDRLRKDFYINSIPNYFAQDRSLLIKIALPCGTSWKFWWINLQNSRSRSRRPRNLSFSSVQNRAAVRSVLKSLIRWFFKIVLPLETSSKIRRFILSRGICLRIYFDIGFVVRI